MTAPTGSPELIADRRGQDRAATPHWTRRPLTRWAAAAAAIGLSFALDEPVKALFSRLNFQGLSVLFLLVAPVARALPLVIIGILFLVGVRTDNADLKRLARRILISVLVTSLVVLIAKPLFGRQEIPPEDPSVQQSWIQERWGRFPSHETAVAFTLVTPLATAAPWAAPALYGLALLVAAGRLYRTAHLFSDVVAGGLLGFAVARWVERRDRASDARTSAASPAPPPTPLPHPAVSPTARSLLGLSVLTIPLFFLGLGAWPLLDPDEGRYALIPAEMLARHDLVTPTLNHTLYFEKPPLMYWSVAAAFRVFDSTEWAARLVPATAALAGVFVAFLIGRRMFGHRAGVWGAVILASSLMWAVLARELVIDMQFSLLIFAALALWWLVHTTQPRARVFDIVAFWITLGLALLSKGPVAVVLVGASIGVYAVWSRQWRVFVDWRWLAGAPLMVLVAAPWFVLVAARHPEFNRFFWYEQHLGRYLGLPGSLEHEQPFWYFGWVLPLGLFPWSAFLLTAAVRGWRALRAPVTPRRRAGLFLFCSAAVITLFFSASTCKLATYILPALPLLAVGLGAVLDDAARRRAASGWSTLRPALVVSGAVLALGAAALVVWGAPFLQREEALAAWPAYAFATLLGAWASGLLLLARSADARRTLVLCTWGATTLMVGLVVLLATIAPNHAVKPLLDVIRPGLARGAELVTYDGWMPSLGFYTQRRIKVIGWSGEMDFGESRLPDAERAEWFPPKAGTLREIFAQPGPVYCLVGDHESAQQLVQDLGGSAVEITWNSRRAIIGNAAAAALTPPQPGGILGSTGLGTR